VDPDINAYRTTGIKRKFVSQPSLMKHQWLMVKMKTMKIVILRTRIKISAVIWAWTTNANSAENETSDVQVYVHVKHIIISIIIHIWSLLQASLEILSPVQFNLRK
jgi:hypothetical protein